MGLQTREIDVTSGCSRMWTIDWRYPMLVLSLMTGEEMRLRKESSELISLKRVVLHDCWVAGKI